MDWSDLEQQFSAARLGRYKGAYSGDTAKAAIAYSQNMMVSEAMMPMLNVLEIALRNGIHAKLSALYGKSDWWSCWSGNPLFGWQTGEVGKAIAKLKKRHEAQTPDKVVAELTFGFWSSLFNVQFQHTLWKDLRFVFPKCPKAQRKRHTVSAALNQIRDLRNRVFHHEPLLWLTPALADQHTLGLMTIEWIEPKLLPWLGTHDRFPSVWSTWQLLP